MSTALGCQLAQMVDKREFSDVEFLVGPDQTPVYALRTILVARSPVFAAQFTGDFKEGVTPPSSSTPAAASPASSSSSSSSSLPPQLFWRVPLLEVEPTVFRCLLHCCYTDHLPPDLANPPAAGGSDGSTRARYLVSLYAAADRFLLDHCTKIVRRELRKAINRSNVLAVFGHALTVAPELAKSGDVFLPVIHSNATQLLGDTDEVAEAQWLAMSTAGAKAVVDINLSGLREVDVFRAVERWYRRLAEEEDDQQAEQSGAEEKPSQAQPAEQQRKRRRVEGGGPTASQTAVESVLEGIDYLMMSGDEIRDVVEASGLLSDKQLLAIYRESSLYHRKTIVLSDALRGSTSAVWLFSGVIRDGQMAWSAKLVKEDGDYAIYINNKPRVKSSAPASSGRVSYTGISIRLYLDHEGHVLTFTDEDTSAVNSALGCTMCAIPQLPPKHVLALVHVPEFAMGPV